jgi:hypothetical protein
MMAIPSSRRFRRIVSLVLGTALAAVVSLVATTMSATPAQAASGCSGYFGPYWFAGVDATNDAGHLKVLAVESPWTSGSHSYIWDYNNDLRQKWCLQRTYQIVDDIYTYKFRLASDNTLCLGGSQSQGAWPVLGGCTAAAGAIEFHQYVAGTANGNEAYRFKAWPNETYCLDVYNGDSANGTHVILWTCNGQDNQRWY